MLGAGIGILGYALIPSRFRFDDASATFAKLDTSQTKPVDPPIWLTRRGQQMSEIPEGWYPDELDPGYERYWDGTQWTEHSRPEASVSRQQPPRSDPGSWAPSSSGFSTDPRQAKAQAKAANAHAKAVRPWFKKKRFVLGGIVALIVVLAIATGGGDNDETTSNASTDSGTQGAAQPGEEATQQTDTGVACRDAGPDDQVDTKRQGVFPDRADILPNDHEAVQGDCVRLAGYTAFMEAAAVAPREFGDPLLKVDVRVLNRDDTAQPYNMFDWSVLTPAGTILNPTISLSDDGIGSGDLVNGGEVSGSVAFDTADPGTYYVIYKPDPFSDDRGIWKVEI